MSELAVVERNELASAQSPVAWAIANNVSPQEMLQYYQLDREIKADAARNAFNEAFAKFKAEAVTILKNTKVAAGPLSGTMYANLYDVVAVIIPALAKHGLSHSWKLTKDERDWMEVTCFIRHSLGHHEENFMGSAPDAGPGRNAIQARGSAMTYLERYTLLAATGMAAGGTDDDGGGGGNYPKMDEKAFVSWMDAIENASTDAELIRSFKGAYKEAFDFGDMGSVQLFTKAKDKRKAEL